MSEERGDQYNYIRRGGRFTSGQARSLNALGDKYLVQTLASHHGSVGIEIGFGMGHALLDWAMDCPDWFLYGIELYQPGVGALLGGLEANQINHVNVIQRPAQLVLAEVQEGTIDEIRIFFPDPWPKKRHAKRRLIQPEFVKQLASCLKSQARVRLATDWQPYADWMRSCFEQAPEFSSEALDLTRSVTKFEARGQRLGHAITDLCYRRV